MPQKQRIVDVELISGKKLKGIATGNNAAWLCACGRKIPLMGRTGLEDRLADGFRVACPDCACNYSVIPDGKDMGPVLKIIEV
jgi:hypothetical protein